MSIFGKSKSAAKFIFVKIPAGILGVNTLRSNHQTIKALYETLLGSSAGPRMGSFIALFGIANTRRLIAEALG